MGWVEDFAIGAAAGAVVVYLLLSGLRWARDRTAGSADGGRVPDALFAPDPIGPVGDGHVLRGEPDPRPGTVWPGLPYPSGIPGARPEVGRPSDGPRPASASETITLSRRIVVHLFGLGRAGVDAPGRPEATQQGICAALSAEQSAVSKVLRRLVAAEVVEVARRHVRGRDRRVYVYALTRRGELLAHELRSRALAPGGGLPDPLDPRSAAREPAPVPPKVWP